MNKKIKISLKRGSESVVKFIELEDDETLDFKIAVVNEWKKEQSKVILINSYTPDNSKKVWLRETFDSDFNFSIESGSFANSKSNPISLTQKARAQMPDDIKIKHYEKLKKELAEKGLI